MPLLAELELRVMLGVLQRAGEAVATAVHEEIERRTGRRTSLGSVYITLDRLEKKGLLRSKLGEPTALRGGRAKRYYAVTPAGMRLLRAECLGTQRMWAGLGIVPEKR
jgi:DNA-binding PadR family transcriptional regulator